VPELGQAVKQHREFLRQGDRLALKRKGQLKNQLQRILENQIRATVGERVRSDMDWADLADQIYQKKETPYSLADRILATWRS
jgi:putative protein kinase ArgK-like GTPase of G3E family